jgi:hypothetical protein
VSPAYIKPDPSTCVFGSVYELGFCQFTLNAVTMAQADTAYQTYRYTFRVVTLSRLAQSRFDQYRCIVRETSLHNASPFDMGFRYRLRVRRLQIYAYRYNYGTVGHCAPDTEVHFSRRNFVLVGPIAIGPAPLDST